MSVDNVARGLALRAGASGYYNLQGLDLTGTTDNSAAILAALTTFKNVRLPSTEAGQSVRISSNFAPPSGTKLAGSGMKMLNRTTQVWEGFGTVIVGSIACASRTDVELSDFSLDAAASSANANGLTGTTNGTRRIRINRIYTRSKNHGQLWEKNISDPGMTFGPNGTEINDIIVTDCISASSDPATRAGNGFAVKARGVKFIRCLAYDYTQAFVAVSDNINGATTYSRAQDVDFIDCDGENNVFTYRVYSRDESSTVNANQVKPAKNIRWIGGAIRGAIQHGARIGDSPSGTRALIPNQDVWIFNARITDNGLRGIQFLHLDGGGYSGCHFSDNGLTSGPGENVDWDIAGSVTGLAKGSNSFGGAKAGRETLVSPRTASGTIYSADADVMITNRGATALVSLTLWTPVVGDEITFVVDDADGLRIIAAGSNTIRVIGNVSAAGGRIDSTTVGSVIKLRAISATEWLAVEAVGAWAVT